MKLHEVICENGYELTTTIGIGSKTAIALYEKRDTK